MELEIQLPSFSCIIQLEGDAASTFPQKEKKGLAKREGHPKASNKHTQMQEEEEERKRLSVVLNRETAVVSVPL